MATESQLALELGEKGTRGSLAPRQARAAFLRDPSPRLVCHSTPKHPSGMTQMESWWSMLVRTRLKRGSFPCVDELKQRGLACLDDSNCTRATPCKWTYQGKALAAYTVHLLRPSCTRCLSLYRPKSHPPLSESSRQ